MTILFTAEGHFREGSIGKKWQFEMELGKIILTDTELNLMKKSNISLTDLGTSVDNYKEGFKIPLENIKKAYSIQNRKIYVVVVETRDNHLFTITMAGHRNPARVESIKLSELINTAILANLDVLKETSSPQTHFQKRDNILVCEYCGEKNNPGASFCKNCGKKIN
ncbi:MAG: zinc ribbon domain-containing protein [Candidatus Lokiarchaeota archaeon]|nr:zinc ribbon domain-containing protein [Candidatus Lokiarchaeota archaeon]